jgi:hypothetical protein
MTWNGHVRFLFGGSGSIAFPCQTPSPILRDLELHEEQPPAAARAGDLPLKTPQRGSGKSEQSQ